MPVSRPSAPSAPTPDLAWFAREMLTHTPQTSILDATSLGIFTIGEQSGRLVGAWKNHRILMQDLDTEEVAAALGALLAAVVQTAHAIDLPLVEVMQRQVARVQVAAAPSRARARKPTAGAQTREERPPVAAPLPHVATASVEEPRPRGRPRRQQTDLAPVVATPAVIVAPAKRGRPRKEAAVAASHH